MHLRLHATKITQCLKRIPREFHTCKSAHHFNSAAAQSTSFESGTGTNLTLSELFKDKQKDKTLLLSPVLGSEHYGW